MVIRVEAWLTSKVYQDGVVLQNEDDSGHRTEGGDRDRTLSPEHKTYEALDESSDFEYVGRQPLSPLAWPSSPGIAIASPREDISAPSSPADRAVGIVAHREDDVMRCSCVRNLIQLVKDSEASIQDLRQAVESQRDHIARQRQDLEALRASLDKSHERLQRIIDILDPDIAGDPRSVEEGFNIHPTCNSPQERPRKRARTSEPDFEPPLHRSPSPWIEDPYMPSLESQIQAVIMRRL
ncbi:hypothetical protein GGF50DRAFT_113644 [Schizophyllum commune]